MPYINHDEFALHPASEQEIPEDFDKNKKYYKVVNTLYYKDPIAGKEITIPKGTLTDGASIPRWLWFFVGSPFAGDYIEAALVHDYLYYLALKKGLKITTRKHADQIFYNAMLEYGVSKSEAKTKYKAVRWFGPRF